MNLTRVLCCLSVLLYRFFHGYSLRCCHTVHQRTCLEIRYVGSYFGCCIHFGFVRMVLQVLHFYGCLGYCCCTRFCDCWQCDLSLFYRLFCSGYQIATEVGASFTLSVLACPQLANQTCSAYSSIALRFQQSVLSTLHQSS